MRRLLRELYDKRTSEYFDDVVSFQEREQIVDSRRYQELQERFLTFD